MNTMLTELAFMPTFPKSGRDQGPIVADMHPTGSDFNRVHSLGLLECFETLAWGLRCANAGSRWEDWYALWNLGKRMECAEN
jgi:hypothetical protein